MAKPAILTLRHHSHIVCGCAAGKASSFQTALDDVLGYLEKNGLASISLLPLPATSNEAAADKNDATLAPTTEANSTDTESASAAAGETEAKDADAVANTHGDGKDASATDKAQQASKSSASTKTLEEEISQLQQQAKELFDRRQRLKESASIVLGILDS